MNNEIGWEPYSSDESVAFCIAGGALGRRLLREQQTSPERTFPAPSFRGADVTRECVFQTDSHVVPAGTYTVLLRVDAPPTPMTTAIYATGMLWGPNGHNSGKMLSHAIRRTDHENFATVRVTARR